MELKFNPFTQKLQYVALGNEENCLLALSTNQGGFTGGDIIDLLDNISGKTINNNIIFSNTTHQATLKAGKTYKLQASLRNWGNADTNAIWFRWYDVTNTAYIGISGISVAMSNTTFDGTSTTACVIITPTTDIQIDLRIENLTGTTPGTVADTAWASIEKISEIVLTQTTVEKEWTNFTPTISAVTTAPTLATTHKKHATYKVVGKSLHIIWSYSHIFATGAIAGSGDYLFPIPAGYTIDTSKVELASLENTFGYGTPIGNGHIMQDSAERNLLVTVYDTTQLKLIAGTKFASNGWFSMDINNQKIMFTAEIPIL